jgi:hypothetical protein
VSQDLSLRQRLAGPGGAPTKAVRLGIAAFACFAFLGGFLVHPGRGAESRGGAVVRVEQLAGDVPAAPTPAALELGRVASLPPLQRPRRSRRVPRAERTPTLVEATPTVTPVPTPNPVGTPSPVPTAAPAPPPPPPPVPAPAPPAPRPAPPAGETFDSTG